MPLIKSVLKPEEFNAATMTKLAVASLGLQEPINPAVNLLLIDTFQDVLDGMISYGILGE